MTFLPNRLIIVACICAASAAALADEREVDPWGTLDQLKAACGGRDLDWSGATNPNSRANGKPTVLPHLSQKCRAEIELRAAACAKDPKRKPHFEKRKQYPSFEEYCIETAYARMKNQYKVDPKLEPFKPGKKDPALEKLIAAAYAKEYIGNPKSNPQARFDTKIIKVVIVADDWTIERDAFKRPVSRYIQAVVINENDGYCEMHSEGWTQDFRGGVARGPLKALGAGSMRRDGITCDKVLPPAKK